MVWFSYVQSYLHNDIIGHEVVGCSQVQHIIVKEPIVGIQGDVKRRTIIILFLYVRSTFHMKMIFLDTKSVVVRYFLKGVHKFLYKLLVHRVLS